MIDRSPPPPETANRTRTIRFYSLDALRGIAALTVVLYHWQHFFYIGGAPRGFAPDRLPLHGFLYWLYDKGALAVDLFFVVSGFIFYWLYSTRIHERQMSASRFALLRFSRLWPLHIVTLVVVAVLQACFVRLHGRYFVYQFNDVERFIEHLVGVNGWSEPGFFSFNGPAWSISVEVFLYCLFFLVARFLPLRAWPLFALAIAGDVIFQNSSSFLARGVAPFFVGALTYLAYVAMCVDAPRWTRRVILSTVCLWAIALALSLSLTGAIKPLPMVWRIEQYAPFFFEDCVRLILFPLTVLSLALLEYGRGHLGKRVALIGDISYSSYLLHFPLQLCTALLVGYLGISRDIFYSGWTILAFFFVLIPLSAASHRFFEMPAQTLIRGRFDRRVRYEARRDEAA